MTQLTKKDQLTQRILLILTFLFFLTPMVIDKSFVDKYNPPKEYFFVLVTFLMLSFFGVSSWLKNSPHHLKFNKIDVVFSAYNLLFIVPYLFDADVYVSFNTKFFTHISLLIFYFFIRYTWRENAIKKINSDQIPIFLIGILIIGAALVLLGYFQLLENKFPRGTFDNPGPYTNYLSVVLILILGGLLFKLFKSKLLISSAALFVIASLGLIILAKSRTAWLATFMGIGFLLYANWDLKTVLRKYKGSKIITFIAGFALVVFVISAGWNMYQFKKDSANGRLLIWKTTVETIAEHPILGCGPGSFQAERNISQVHYFKRNWDNEYEKYLADNIEYAFNDFLQITAETGLVGLFGLLLILFFLFTAKNTTKQTTLIRIGLLVLLITSFFSYSLQKVSTNLLFVFFIAVLTSGLSEQKTYAFKLHNVIKKIVGTSILVVSVIVIIWGAKTYHAQRKWKETYQSYTNGNKETALVFYNKLFPILKSDPYFLYNYGIILNFEKLYIPSIEILEKSNAKLYDNDALTFLGNNYRKIGAFHKAEQYYLEAIYLIPHKFVPRYQLVGLYLEMEKNDEALRWAMIILNEEPKIPSKMVDDIKDEMVKLVSKFSTTK